jgi:hypothetical protein
VKWLAPLALACAVASAALASSPLELLRASAAAHPEDGAVARALAAALLAEGQAEEALAGLSDHLARNPAQRAACAELLGRALLATGDAAGAKAALGEAIAHRASDASAHLYLGLAELRLGERDAAAQHLAQAQALDPSLTQRVREVAAARGGALQRLLARVSFSGGVGFEYDTNSTLEGDEDITALPGDSADGRVRYDAALGVTLLRGERAEIGAGYRIDQSQHFDLGELDVQSHAAFVGSTLALSPRTFARVEAGGALNRLDGQRHSQSASLATGFGWLSERRGALELKAFGERRAYDDEPALSSLERDGWRLGANLRHAFSSARPAPSQLVTQLGYARTLTEGRTDAFGLGAAFDAHLVSLDSAFRIALPAQLLLDARLGVAAERFDARNAVDFLSDDGVGDPSPDRRRDFAIDAGVTLTRPITRWLDAQLRIRETRRFSNVDVYDWDRQVVGTQLRLRWPTR